LHDLSVLHVVVILFTLFQLSANKHGWMDGRKCKEILKKIIKYTSRSFTGTREDDDDDANDDGCKWNSSITSWMTFWAKARVFVGIVPAIIATVTDFPAEYAAVVRLATKQAFRTGARFW